MSDDEINVTEAPTRRDYVKSGGAVIGGGLLAGCTDSSDSTSGPTATATETETVTATETETATETDSPYGVEVKPYGTVTFEEVPETYVTMGAGPWTDICLAFGDEPNAMGKEAIPNVWYPFKYYDALPDVSFDVDAISDFGDVTKLDAEMFYETDADVHILDKALLAFYAKWDTDDFEQVEENVGPFAGSYLRGEWSGEALGVEFSFPYYTLQEAVTLVGKIFQQQERASAWNKQLDSFASGIAERAPDGSPDVGLIAAVRSDAKDGSFSITTPTGPGVSTYPYRLLGVSDGFAELINEDTYKTDYEGLLEQDPEYLCVHSGLTWLSAEEMESKFIEPMQDHPIGSELTAVRNDNIIRGSGAFLGPIIAQYETEAIAKQLYPEEFGEWYGLGETPEDERLFDRQRVADIINGDS